MQNVTEPKLDIWNGFDSAKAINVSWLVNRSDADARCLASEL